MAPRPIQFISLDDSESFASPGNFVQLPTSATSRGFINKAFTKIAKKVVPRIMRELAGEGCEAVDVGIGDMGHGTCVSHNLFFF